MSQTSSRRTKSRNTSIAAIKRNRTAKIARLATQAYYLHRRGQDEKMYNLVCDEFVTLGGIYIKFLQGVLLQSSVMRQWHNPARLNIFENLDREPLDIIATLRQELPPDKLAQIVLVQPQPFAAGSFGQVYYGQHANGKPIIIKVVRPMVRELLKYDLKLLSMFSRAFMARMSKNIDVEVDQAIKDFQIATLRETDYIAEAQFATELFNYYKNHPTFIIPETFTDLSTPNIIVQEFINGLSVAQLIHVQEQGADPKKYVADVLGSDLDVQLQTLGVEAIMGIFKLPRIQGDPHPGNIRLLGNNKIGMIDFGIAAPTPNNKAAFFGVVQGWHDIYSGELNISKLFEQFMRFFVNDLYRALQRLSNLNAKKPGDEEAENYTMAMGKLAHDAFVKAAGISDVRSLIEDGRIIGIVNQMINKDNRFGLVLKLDASEILRASQTYITLVEALGRRTAVLPYVFTEVVTRVEREHSEFVHEAEESISINDALETVSKWLERVAQRDPDLFRQLVRKVRGSDKVNSSKNQSSKKTNSSEADTIRKEKVHA